MKKKRVIKLKVEKYFIFGIVFFTILSALGNFILNANLQTSNSELQRLKTKIE